MWKRVLFVDETNIMYLIETDVIMCCENLGKNFGKKIFVLRSNMMMVPRLFGYAWQHQKWKFFILSKAA